MRYLIALIIITISSVSFGQARSSDKGKEPNSATLIQYNYEGNINLIIKTVRKDFGREEILREDLHGKELKFVFQKDDWADEKLQVFFWIMSHGNKHIVNITCFDEDGKDYLNGTQPSRTLIEEYFNKVFNKEAFAK
jgi:hypothetical protein